MLAVDHAFKIHAWSLDGNHVEEELAAFANQIVATRCWDAFVRYYAKRRLTLRLTRHPLEVEPIRPDRFTRNCQCAAYASPASQAKSASTAR